MQVNGSEEVKQHPAVNFTKEHQNQNRIAIAHNGHNIHHICVSHKSEALLGNEGGNSSRKHKRNNNRSL
jgi:hypothetical protein